MSDPTDPTTATVAVLREALRLAIAEERELRDQYAQAAEARTAAPIGQRGTRAEVARLATLAALAHGRAVGFAIALAATHYAEPAVERSEEPGLVLAAATLAACGVPDAADPRADRDPCNVGELPAILRALLDGEPW